MQHTKDLKLSDDLIPKYFFNKITDITPEDLKNMGAKAVAVDVDNTVSYDGAMYLFHGVRDWVKRLKSAGINVIILTNTYNFRAKFFSHLLGNIPYVANAKKPKAKAFLKAAQIMGINVNEMAMVGDQLFTDIRGANNAGAIPIRIRYRRREIMFYKHYKHLRLKERRFLEEKGFGDKL
ncbi:MAG: YqeG family HAD IIIA-type phosphatase [Oscillospiraceae bacterium]|nr:YqeG family HAD IIIA-type phosphatase [Oscillospiraceae bacterium]